MGLLEAAVIDPGSGYRYYRPGQAHSAHLVRRFRDLGLPVADVKAVLAAPDLTARDAILVGTYAGAYGRDGTGPARERYLTDPLDTPDVTLWRTEVCWPLVPAGAPATEDSRGKPR